MDLSVSVARDSAQNHSNDIGASPPPTLTGRLEYMTGESLGNLINHLEVLREAGIVRVYSLESGEDTSEFFGFTKKGVRVLSEFNYFRGIGVMRSLYEQTRKTDLILRHESAPRPDLPNAVQNALNIC